jgi:hypothetical protein
MAKLLGERKERTQGVQRKTSVAQDQDTHPQSLGATNYSQQAAASASFNSEHSALFAGFFIGAVIALYDFAMHIRGADCVSRNRAYKMLNTRRRTLSSCQARAAADPPTG